LLLLLDFNFDAERWGEAEEGEEEESLDAEPSSSSSSPWAADSCLGDLDVRLAWSYGFVRRETSTVAGGIVEVEDEEPELELELEPDICLETEGGG
jgi:hypothetical protein